MQFHEIVSCFWNLKYRNVFKTAPHSGGHVICSGLHILKGIKPVAPAAKKTKKKLVHKTVAGSPRPNSEIRSQVSEGQRATTPLAFE